MRLVAALVVALALAGPAAGAQEPPSTPTTLVEVPTRDIIPKPGSGATPEDPGDRGGALQITVLVLVLLAIGTVVVLVVRQSRRARSGGYS